VQWRLSYGQEETRNMSDGDRVHETSMMHNCRLIVSGKVNSNVHVQAVGFLSCNSCNHPAGLAFVCTAHDIGSNVASVCLLYCLSLACFD